MTTADTEPPAFDTSVAHPARVYDYWLGGKDNFQADRDAAEQAVAAYPNILPGVQANRAFLRRAVDADARDTAAILAEAARVLDFSQPIGVMALLILQYIPDADHPGQLISTIMDAVPSGSYLTVTDTTRDIHPDQGAAVTQRLNARMGPAQLTMRTRDEILTYFDGLDLVEPGLVPVPHWRPVTEPSGLLNAYAGVARKP